MSNTAGEGELRRSCRDHPSSRRLDAATARSNPVPSVTGIQRKEAPPSGNSGKEVSPGGLVYLKEQITLDLMKKAGVEKPEAEDLIEKKWAGMTVDQQNWWNELKKKEVEEGEARASRGDSTSTGGVPDKIQVEIQVFSWPFEKMKYLLNVQNCRDYKCITCTT